MADDYSLDPLQVQEDELNALYKRAMARTVRQKWDPNDPYGSASAGIDNAIGERDAKRISQQKMELSDQMQKRMTEALRGVPDELAAGYRDPGSRAEFAKQIAKFRENEVAQNKIQEIGSQYGPGVTGNQTIAGGGTGDNPYGRAKALSENPFTHTYGKQAMENLAPHDPSKSVRIDSQGNYSVIPGAIGAVQQTEDAKMRGRDDIIDFKTADGTVMKVPRSWAEAEMRRSFSGAAPSSPPSAPPTAPATSPLGGAVAAASGANTPVPGGPSGGAPPIFSPTMSPADRARAMQDYTGQRPFERQDSVLPNATAAAMPPAQGPGVRGQPPTGPSGQGPSPYQVKAAEARNQTDEQMYQKYMEGMAALPTTRFYVQDILERNKNKTYEGYQTLPEVSNKIAATLGQGNSPTYTNTRAMSQDIENLKGALLKQYGTNPSDRDLAAISGRIPSMEDSAATREELAKALLKYADKHEFVAPTVDQLMKTQNMGFIQAQIAADQIYRQKKAEEESRRNPTQAPGSQSALPGAAAAAQMTHQHSSGQGYEPEGGGGIERFGADLGNNLASLPGSMFSKSGWEGMKDSYGNIITAGRQLAGGDRSGWEAENNRQETRRNTDKAYDQARTYHDIANPTALIGGTSTGIARNVAAGTVQGLLQPNSTLTGQLVSGGKNAAYSGAGAGLALGIPTTHPNPSLGPDAQAILDKYPELAKTVTSAQLNPKYYGSHIADALGINRAAAEAQQKALTTDLLRQTAAGPAGAGGVAPTVMSRETIAKAMDDFSKEYKTLLPAAVNQGTGTATISIRSADQAKMSSAISSMPRIQDMFGKAEAPTLAKIGAMLDPAQGTTRKVVDAATMHEAWKEVGKVATGPQEAKAVRKVLEDLITQVMPNQDIKHFRELNQRYGDFQDMERIWSQGGGGGKAAARGSILPAKLETEAGRGPNTGSATDQAMDVVNMLRQSNEARPTVSGRMVQNIVGPILYHLDNSATQASPAVKRMLDALRAYSVRGAPRIQNEMTPGANDAP